MNENDRKERNRINQRRRRQGLLRIDYVPIGDARKIIEIEKERQGKEFCISTFLDNAVTVWAEDTSLNGDKWPEAVIFGFHLMREGSCEYPMADPKFTLRVI